MALVKSEKKCGQITMEDKMLSVHNENSLNSIKRYNLK